MREATATVNDILQRFEKEYTDEKEATQNPYPEVVDFGSELKHCIHPEFLKDQLDLMLKRLKLNTLDVFLSA